MSFGDIGDILSDIGYNVVVEREIRTDGGYTGDTVTWSTLATIIASIQNLAGNEIEQADKRGIQATHRMYCEPANMTEKDRVLFNRTYYQIQYIDNELYLGKYYKILLKQSDNYTSVSN